MKSRGVRFKTDMSKDARDGGVLEERNYYDVLDDIVDDSVLLNYKGNEIRNTNAGVEASYERKEVTVAVPPPMYVQPDRLTLSPVDDVTSLMSNNPDRSIGLPTVNTDGVRKTKDNREQTLYNSDSDCVTITGQGVEPLPVPSVEVQSIIAEGVNTDESPAEQVPITETTKQMVSTQLVTLSQECLTKSFFRLAEEAKLVVTSLVPFDDIIEDVQRSPEITMSVVQTDLRNLPCKKITGGFLRLAEEALLVDVELTPSNNMEEIEPQRCGFGELMSKDISWRREDIVDRSVDFVLKEAMRMPTSVVEEYRSLQGSIEECTDEVRCTYARKSQMPSQVAVVREPELVFVATEFEVFNPVFMRESVVATAPLVVAEAVTTRVSALPMIGSNFQTGLSTDRLAGKTGVCWAWVAFWIRLTMSLVS